MGDEATLAARLKAEAAEANNPQRSRWWDVSRWSLRVALAVVLIAQTVVIVVLTVFVAGNNSDATCRSQVIYDMLHAQNRLVDAAVSNDPVRRAEAVALIHEVERKAQALIETKSCGYTGTIPPPSTTTKP